MLSARIVHIYVLRHINQLNARHPPDDSWWWLYLMTRYRGKTEHLIYCYHNSIKSSNGRCESCATEGTLITHASRFAFIGHFSTADLAKYIQTRSMLRTYKSVFCILKDFFPFIYFACILREARLSTLGNNFHHRHRISSHEWIILFASTTVFDWWCADVVPSWRAVDSVQMQCKRASRDLWLFFNVVSMFYPLTPSHRADDVESGFLFFTSVPDKKYSFPYFFLAGAIIHDTNGGNGCDFPSFSLKQKVNISYAESGFTTRL